jgi:prolipoprotein diacylglyceryltransferase
MPVLSGMPPAGSIWAGALSIFGALLGVLIAQIWTTRRENRNWERQREMYAQQWEDQRERDAEQREDQRQRDRELWAREDQYRFKNCVAKSMPIYFPR